jgi:hypothetical protein
MMFANLLSPSTAIGIRNIVFKAMVTNSMEQNSSWDIDSLSAGQEIPRSPPLYPILTQINPVHILTPYYL